MIPPNYEYKRWAFIAQKNAVLKEFFEMLLQELTQEELMWLLTSYLRELAHDMTKDQWRERMNLEIPLDPPESI